MINFDNKILKKMYIEETLKTRKYLGFRLDIALLKIIIIAIVSSVIYTITNDLKFMVVISIQLFMILTLINKIVIDKKIQAGKKLLSEKVKFEKFKNKIFTVSYNEFENFIMLYLNQYRYKCVKKMKNYVYSAINENQDIIINLFRYYENANIEKIDLRNSLGYAINKKAKKLVIITVNELSKEAEELINDMKDILDIEIISLNFLYNFADNNNLLSINYDDYDFSYVKKNLYKNKISPINNIVIGKKSIIYVISAILFYILDKIFIYNSLIIYISYYFMFLAVINIGYNFFNGLIKKNI